jgi:1-acyl-sn-glycerol-3-phosphate acyltransferase
MARQKIYQKDLGYDILRPIVDWNVKQSYRRVAVKGQENIPTDGAVILAPNHCNTLMDALVILRSNKKETVFGARADMFNIKLVAKIMFFLRILPMVRQRDGLRNVLKNKDTEEIIVETLEHGVPFCIFPEGKHRAAHSLQVLGKGVFRAALSANARFGDKKPVYIVPVGIEYGDYFRYHSTSLVTYGKAINVTEFVKSLEVENEAQMIEPLRKELTKRMSELITYIDYNEDYDGKWTLTRLLSLRYKNTLEEQMKNNRRIIAEIEQKYEKNPEAMKDLLDKTARFDKVRRKKGVSIYSFAAKNSFTRVFLKTLAALIMLPAYVFSAVASLPLWGISAILRKIIKDRAFKNTATFGVRLAGCLTYGPACIALAFCLLPWKSALFLLLLMIPTYPYFYDYNEFIRRFVSDIKLSFNSDLKKFKNEIIDTYKSI